MNWLRNMVIERNTFVDGPWVLKKIENRTICDSFDCEDDDLNEYFHVDAVLHKQELLTESYCLQITGVPHLAVALLDFCFVTDNRTGCRFLTVDAYNKPAVIKFYERNGFKLFTYKDKAKDARALYFDLKRLGFL